MRRGVDDEKWQALKKKIRARDKSCRCCAILTPTEMVKFEMSKPYGPWLSILDCAHRHPVSTHLDEAYNEDNVFLLCRAHHHRIDDFHDPVTDKPIDEAEHEKWWDRIAAGVSVSNIDLDVEDLWK